MQAAQLSSQSCVSWEAAEHGQSLVLPLLPPPLFSAQLPGQDAEVQVKGFRSRRAGIGLDLCTHASVATTVHWWLLSPSACSSAPVLCTLQRLHRRFLYSLWACSSMCTSEAKRVFFLARKVFTMAMIRETGVSEHIICYYSTAVPCNVPFLFH